MARIDKRTLDPKSFKADISADDFAATFDALPRIFDLVRRATLSDGEKLATARAAAADRAVIRARALGKPEDEVRAVEAALRARTVGAALRTERVRVTPEEDVVGKPAPSAREFRIQGKVLTSTGKPADKLAVDMATERSGLKFSATTDPNGVFALDIPVGDASDQAKPKEQMTYVVRSGRTILARSGKDAPIIIPGAAARIRVILPATARPMPPQPASPTDVTPPRPAGPVTPRPSGPTLRTPTGPRRDGG